MAYEISEICNCSCMHFIVRWFIYSHIGGLYDFIFFACLIVYDPNNSWCTKSSADCFTQKYEMSKRTDTCWCTLIHTLTSQVLSGQRKSCDSFPAKCLHSVIRSVCLDAVLHLWWKLSHMDSFLVWVLALLVVVCRMSLKGCEIAISDFVKDRVLQTLGDCQRKARLLLPEHALNIKGMMEW